jgi:predicted RNA binding protein YcfA (HicA-like mRNA interferase family)
MKREELIQLLRKNGFSGPHSGTKHQIMLKGEVRVRLPNPHRHEIGKELISEILKQAGIGRGK